MATCTWKHRRAREILVSALLLSCKSSLGFRCASVPCVVSTTRVGVRACRPHAVMFKEGTWYPKANGPTLDSTSTRWTRSPFVVGRCPFHENSPHRPQTSTLASGRTASDDDRGSQDESDSEDGLVGAGQVEIPLPVVDTAAVALSPGLEAAAAAQGTEEAPTRWEPDWMPAWAVRMPVAAQVVANLALYMFHMLFLSKSSMAFPVQLIPNKYGLFQSIGLDTLAGFAVLALAVQLRLWAKLPIFPPLRREKMPWQLNGSKMKEKLPVTVVVLMLAYMLSGWGSQLCEYLLYLVGLMGIPMSVAMHRSVQVLMSHLLWVGMGVRILGMALRPFFNRDKGNWLKMKWRTNWLWWVVGGYYVSASLFNMADLANHFVCPLPPDTESVVVKIINPENNDVAAMAVGSIAPCVTAPWWEEVLYRGFLLPALTFYLPITAAVPVGAVLFAAHHMNLQAMLPLSILGLVWSLLYMFSGNLVTTIIIHAMWNSRVFLGSLLGL